MTATDEKSLGDDASSSTETDELLPTPDAHAFGPVRVVRETARRRKAQRRRKRATTVVSGFTVIFVVLAMALGFAGWKATMRITGGQEVKVTDPAAPGYTAEAQPTDVQLLAFTNNSGGLATTLMFTGGAGTNSTTVVPVSAGLVVWEFEEAGPVTLRDLFADAGLDVLTLRLGVDLTFGIESSASMPIAEMQPLFDSMGPITTELPDIVYTLDENGERVIHYPAGEMTIEPDQVADFLSFTGDGEAELNRSLRLKPVWQKIIEAYLADPSLVGSPSEVRDKVSLWTQLDKSKPAPKGAEMIQVLPTNVIGLYTTPPVYLDKIDADAMPGWVASFVPFPSAAFPGQRVIVNLLNGTSDRSVIQKVSPRIVTAGGSIGMTGNAESFDIAASKVEYVNAAADQRANRIASELGTTATKIALLPSGVDVQVTVGNDQL